MINIESIKQQLNEICQQTDVSTLYLFGSATGENFGPNSDVDIIVRFTDQAKARLFDQYFNLKEQLEKLFERSVDVVMEGSIRNPYFAQEIENTKVKIYEQKCK